MAHHSATKKSIRQIAKRTEDNIFRRTQMKNSVKKVISAIEENDATAANEALENAQSKLFRAAKAGVIKKETASRKVKRLNAAIKSIAGSAKKTVAKKDTAKAAAKPAAKKPAAKTATKAKTSAKKPATKATTEKKAAAKKK